MNQEDLLQLLREARAARIAGAPLEAVNSRISALTNGQYADLAGLAGAAFAPPEHEARRERAEIAVGARQAGPIGRGAAQVVAMLTGQPGLPNPDLARGVEDFGRAGIQSATFGFAPELAGLGAAIIPGGRGFREAHDASQQRIEDLREVAPGATLLSELAGGLTVPGLGAKALVPRLGRVGAGATVGAGAGGLFGLGEAEGNLSERLPRVGASALFGGTVGAAIPGATGLGQRLFRAFVPPKPGPAAGRVLAESGVTPDRLRRLLAGDVPADMSIRARATAVQAGRGTRSGIPEARLQTLQFRATEGAKNALRETAEAVYTPLEALPDVPLGAFGVLSSRVADAIRHVVPRNVLGDDAATLSVRHIQSIVTELREGVQKARGRPAQHKEAVDALTEFLNLAEKNVPGLREANRIYAQQVAQTKRWKDTWKAIQTANPNLIQREFPSPGFGIRQLLARILVGGEGRKMEAAEMVADVMLDEGPRALERLKKLYPSTYRRVLNEFSSAAAGAVTGSVLAPRAAPTLFGGN